MNVSARQNALLERILPQIIHAYAFPVDIYLLGVNDKNIGARFELI